MIGRTKSGISFTTAASNCNKAFKKNVEGYKRDHIFGVLLLTIGWNNNQTFVKGLHVAPTANIALYLNKKQFVEKLN